ncbi:MAG: 2-isopropylmalate synthase [Planctomycetota bacterium]|jgi:2-isopropylmalate synthase|nr:2-isopropylmalate synthase [Planctomycetota bacterium]
MKRIALFDTTLRDGEQAAHVNLNAAEKLQVARQLEAMRIDVIEAGFPASSPGDFACVRAVAGEVRGVAVAALARAREDDIRRAAEALEGAVRPRLHVFIASSPIHMRLKLRMTPAEVLAAIRTSIPLARSLCPDVQFSAEDASRSDPDFLVELYRAAAAGGAATLNITDTVGYARPGEFESLFRRVIAGVGAGPDIVFSAHCHNDLGLATANSLAAIRAGAGQIEVTLNGLGERGGNAALEEIVMNLRVRRDFHAADTRIDASRLVAASRLASRLTGVVVSPNKPVVGANAFSHESGIHQQGIIADRSTYEIIRAEDVGAEAAVIVLGKHSGRNALGERLEKLGYSLPPWQIDKAFAAFKKLCDEKREISDGDLEALAAEIVSAAPERVYTLGAYEINCGNRVPGGPTAWVALRTNDGKEICDAAVGNGPVDAAYIAMQRIIGLNLTLENFAITATSQSSDAAGEAQVTVRHASGISASGRGISTDTVKACIIAYLSAVNNLYMAAAAKEIRIGTGRYKS